MFRTNCVDCLDRTNVVQGLLARHALEVLLQELGVLSPREELGNVLPQVGPCAYQASVNPALFCPICVAETSS